MRAKQRAELSRVFSGKFLVMVGTMKPPTFCDFADSVATYEEKAVALARSAVERRRLRDFLAGPGRASPLFDTAKTTAALEAAYLTMADQFRRRVREPFRVPAMS